MLASIPTFKRYLPPELLQQQIDAHEYDVIELPSTPAPARNDSPPHDSPKPFFLVSRKIAGRKDLAKFDSPDALDYLRTVYLLNSGALSILLRHRSVVKEQLDSRTLLCAARNLTREYESEKYETCWDDAYDKPPKPRRAPAALEFADEQLLRALHLDELRLRGSLRPDLLKEAGRDDLLAGVGEDAPHVLERCAFVQRKHSLRENDHFGRAAKQESTNNTTSKAAGAARNAVRVVRDDVIDDRETRANLREMARRKLNRERVSICYRGPAGWVETLPEDGMGAAHFGKDREPQEVNQNLAKSGLLPSFAACCEELVPAPGVVTKCIANVHHCLHFTTPSLRGDQRKKAALGVRVPSLGAVDWWHLVDGRDPVPLHLYVVCMVLFHNRDLPEIRFEVCDLQSREEATYFNLLVKTAVSLLPAAGGAVKPAANSGGAFGGLRGGAGNKLKGLAGRALLAKKTGPKIKITASCEHPRFLLDCAAPALFQERFDALSLGWSDQFFAYLAKSQRLDPRYRVLRRSSVSVLKQGLQLQRIFLRTAATDEGKVVGSHFLIKPFDVRETLAGRQKIVQPGGPELFNPFLDAASEELVSSNVICMLELLREVVAHVQIGLDGLVVRSLELVRPALCMWDFYTRYWAARTQHLDDRTEFEDAKSDALETAYKLFQHATRFTKNPFLWDGRLDLVRREAKKIMFFRQMGQDEDAETDEEQGAEVQGLMPPMEKDGPGQNEVAREILMIDEDLQVESRDPRQAKLQLPYSERELRREIKEALQYLTNYVCNKDSAGLWFPEPARGPWSQVNDDPTLVLRYYDMGSLDRGRMTLWIEVYHGRLPRATFLRMLFEEYRHLEKAADIVPEEPVVGQEDEATPLSDLVDHASVLRFTSSTRLWYRVSLRLLLQLVLDPDPPDNLQEVLSVFLFESFFSDADQFKDPWDIATKLCSTGVFSDKENFLHRYWSVLSNEVTEMSWYLEKVLLCVPYAEAMVLEAEKGSFKNEQDCLNYSKFLIEGEALPFEDLQCCLPFEQGTLDEQTRHDLKGIGGLKQELRVRVRGILQAAVQERLQKFLINDLPFRWLRLQRGFDNVVKQHAVPGASVALLRPSSFALDARPVALSAIAKNKAAGAGGSSPTAGGAGNESSDGPNKEQAQARRQCVNTLRPHPIVSVGRPIVSGKSGFMFFNARKLVRADTQFSLGSFSHLFAAAFLLERVFSPSRRNVPEAVGALMESVFFDIDPNKSTDAEDDEDALPPKPKALFELVGKTPVNEILRALRSSYKLMDIAGATGAADQVTMRDLMGHTVLESKQLVGCGKKEPRQTLLEILQGKPPGGDKHRPPGAGAAASSSGGLVAEKLYVARNPREEFSVSPTGWVVLQFLLQEMFCASDPQSGLKEVTRQVVQPWLERAMQLRAASGSSEASGSLLGCGGGLSGLGFAVTERMNDEANPANSSEADEEGKDGKFVEPYAALGHPAYYDPGKTSTSRRYILQYPELAGGAIASPTALARFLAHAVNGFSVSPARSLSLSTYWLPGGGRGSGSAGLGGRGDGSSTSQQLLLAQSPPCSAFSDETARLFFDRVYLSSDGELLRAADTQPTVCGALMFGGAFESVDGSKLLIQHWSNDGSCGMLLLCVHGPDFGKGAIICANQSEKMDFLIDALEKVIEHESWRLPIGSLVKEKYAGAGKAGESVGDLVRQRSKDTDDRQQSTALLSFQGKLRDRYFREHLKQVQFPRDLNLTERLLADRGPKDALLERFNLFGPDTSITLSHASDGGCLGLVDNLFAPFFPATEYDGWCTRRHNPEVCDYLRFEIPPEQFLTSTSASSGGSGVRGSWLFLLSTGLVEAGDLPESVRLAVLDRAKGRSVDVLAKAIQPLPRSQHWVRLQTPVLQPILDADNTAGRSTVFELRLFPDGGVARIAAFAEKQLREGDITSRNSSVADTDQLHAFLANEKASSYVGRERSPYDAVAVTPKNRQNETPEGNADAQEPPKADVANSAFAFARQRPYLVNQEKVLYSRFPPQKRSADNSADVFVNVAAAEWGATVFFPPALAAEGDETRQDLAWQGQSPFLQTSNALLHNAVLSDNIQLRHLPVTAFPKPVYTHQPALKFPRQRNQDIGQGSVIAITLARDKDGSDNVKGVRIHQVEIDFSHNLFETPNFVEVFATNWALENGGKLKEKQMLERAQMLVQSAKDAGNEGVGSRLLRAAHFVPLSEKRYAKSYAGGTMVFRGEEFILGGGAEVDNGGVLATHVAVRFWPCGACGQVRVLSLRREARGVEAAGGRKDV